MANCIKAKIGDIVLIEWFDATSYDEWSDHDHKVELARIISCGIVNNIDFDRITLVLNRDMSNDGASLFMSIPFGMISRCKILKRAKNDYFD